MRQYMINMVKKMTGERGGEDIRCTWLQKKLSEIPAGKKILDAGAGELRWKSACTHLDYISQDFCQYDGTGDDRGLQTGTWNTAKIDIVCDVIDMPFEDNSFDVVLCTEVLEHLPYPELAIKEFSRILKKDGIMILTAPFASLTHFAPYHFCTGFNCYWYEKHLQDYGCEIQEINKERNYFECIKMELAQVPMMVRNYSNYELRLIDKVLLILMMRRLYKMSLRDLDSGQVLCQGYHVIGRKI